MKKLISWQRLVLLLVILSGRYMDLWAAPSTDSLYYAVASRCEALQQEVTQLENELVQLRTDYRTSPELRTRLTPSILDLEERLLELRRELTPQRERLNQLEKERALQNLATRPTSSETNPVRVEEEERDYSSAPRVRNLVENACFRGELPEEEYLLLLEAQRAERVASEQMIRFMENYARLTELLPRYGATTDQGEADSLYERMTQLQAENRLLENSLSTNWNHIWDHKGYAYNYLLESVGAESLLTQQVACLSEAAAHADSQVGVYVSDVLTAYLIQKRALVASELSLAGYFELTPAIDSLAEEQAYLKSIDYRLPRIDFSRRLLLDYSPITFVDKSPYTPYNLPECKVYPRGTIYRILLGSYKYRQQLAIFRGVEPLYILTEGGRMNYYAGGFASHGEASSACKVLRERGFKHPIIVRWSNGEREELAEIDVTERYRVEISGETTLSEEMRKVVSEYAPDKELARAGSTFLVGPFEEEYLAEVLAGALRRTDGSWTIRVVKMAE